MEVAGRPLGNERERAVTSANAGNGIGNGRDRVPAIRRNQRPTPCLFSERSTLFDPATPSRRAGTRALPGLLRSRSFPAFPLVLARFPGLALGSENRKLAGWPRSSRLLSSRVR